MKKEERERLLRELGAIVIERLRHPTEDNLSTDQRKEEILSSLGLSLEDAMEELQRILVNSVGQ